MRIGSVAFLGSFFAYVAVRFYNALLGRLCLDFDNFFAATGCAGAALMMLGGASALAGKLAKNSLLCARLCPGLPLPVAVKLKKREDLPRLSQPPHIGLFGIAIWSIFGLMAFVGTPWPRAGLPVSWPRYPSGASQARPWKDTLEIVVPAPGRFFLNGREVPRTELESELRAALSRRIEWTVYFEADLDSQYMDTVYAIETIQKCGAKPYWITPRVREEWKRNEGSTSSATGTPPSPSAQ